MSNYITHPAVIITTNHDWVKGYYYLVSRDTYRVFNEKGETLLVDSVEDAMQFLQINTKELPEPIPPHLLWYEPMMGENDETEEELINKWMIGTIVVLGLILVVGLVWTYTQGK